MPRTGRRPHLWSVAAAVLIGASLAAGPADAVLPRECGPADGVVTCTYQPIGDEQRFVVPYGVTRVHAVLVGARGFSLLSGQAARATADLPVTPGHALWVQVGGAGGGGGYFGGGGGASAAVPADACRAPLAVAAGCTVSVALRPTTSGPKRARLEIAVDGEPKQTIASPAGAADSGPAQRRARDRAEGDVVGDLRRLRERADGGDPPSDQPQVQRGDAEPGEGAPGRAVAGRQDAVKRERPAERERQMHGDGGGEPHGGRPVRAGDDRARGERGLQRRPAPQERVDGRRGARQRRRQERGAGDAPAHERAASPGRDARWRTARTACARRRTPSSSSSGARRA